MVRNAELLVSDGADKPFLDLYFKNDREGLGVGAYGLIFQTIDGGPYGVCHFEIGSDGFKQAWEEAFTWLVNCGYECADKPSYERYHNDAADHPEGNWVVDICIPLKPSI
jgi:AraC family transcriptional regulator